MKNYVQYVLSSLHDEIVFMKCILFIYSTQIANY